MLAVAVVAAPGPALARHAAAAASVELTRWEASADASTSTAAPKGKKKQRAESAPLEIELPVKVRGKVPTSTKGRLTGRLEAAVAGTSVEGGPFRVRMTVALAKKKNYTITLTVVDPADATVVELSEACKGCSQGEAGTTVAELVTRVAQAVAELPPPAGTLSVTSVPAGAQVSVDGEPRGTSPQSLELPPGEHEVVVTHAGYEDRRETVVVEPGEPQALELSLTETAAAAVGPSEPEPSKRKRERGSTSSPADTGPKAGKPWTIAGGVMLGLGLAGVLTGVAFILVDEQAIPSKCKGDQVDFRGVCRVRYDTLLGGALGVAGGALAIGGGIALMVKGRKVTMKARAGKGQASLGVTLRF